jgi:hypothetical protein
MSEFSSFALIRDCVMDRSFTTQPVAASWGIDPEFCDFAGLKHQFGIGRSLAYVLIERGDITSKVLRRRGNVKGKRIISVDSVRRYIASQSDDIDPRLSAVCKKANRAMLEKKREREAAIA